MGRVRNGIFNTFQARLLIALLFCGWLSLGLVGLILALTGRIAFTEVGIPFLISLIFSSFIALALTIWLLPMASSMKPSAAVSTAVSAEVLPPGDSVGDVIAELDPAGSTLRDAQRLESLGLLAGGIAHDFNNLLTGMLGNASLVQAMLEPDDPAQAQVQRLMSTAGRAADLARQLLAYAGKAEFEIGPIDLNKFLDESVRLLETAMPRRVELLTELTQPLPMVEGDRGQIQQLVMNLVINAAEAMPPAGGKVTVMTEKQLLTGNESVALVDGVSLPAGPYVCLAVRDNGSGMNRTTMSQIFDPFFTTKEQGHGLGLSASLGIMQTHQGGIEVDSTLDEGTTFRLYFPAQQPRSRSVSAPIIDKGHLHGTVLIVDDDHDVRRVAADILSTLGMQVLQAQHGQAGLDCYEAHQGGVDVVLLDVKMPVLDGEDTYRALKKMDPNAQIVVSTGYGEVEASALLAELGASEFLSKPYDFEALVNKMRTLVPSEPQFMPTE